MYMRTAHAVRWFRKFLRFPTSSAFKGQGGLSSLEGPNLRGPLERLGLASLSYGASGFGCQGISKVRARQVLGLPTYNCKRPCLHDRLKFLREVVGFSGLQNILGFEGCWAPRPPPPTVCASSWPPVSRTFGRLWGHRSSTVLRTAAIERSSGQNTNPRPAIYDWRQQTLTGPKPHSLPATRPAGPFHHRPCPSLSRRHYLRG